MSATATHQAPSVEELLRAEVEVLRAELQQAREDAVGWEREAKFQRARRETTLDLAGVHVRAFAAFFEHTQAELKRDAEEEKAQP